MYVLSFGPRPSYHGMPFWYRPPYAWLMELPGFQNVPRTPARFAMLAQLCLAAAAALAVVRIRERLSPRIAAGVVGAAIAVAVADGWIPRAAAGRVARTLRLARNAERRSGRGAAGGRHGRRHRCALSID